MSRAEFLVRIPAFHFFSVIIDDYLATAISVGRIQFNFMWVAVKTFIPCSQKRTNLSNFAPIYGQFVFAYISTW